MNEMNENIWTNEDEYRNENKFRNETKHACMKLNSMHGMKMDMIVMQIKA